MSSAARVSHSANRPCPKDSRDARMVLNSLPNIGPVTCRRLMDELGADPLTIFRASRDELLTVKGVGATMADTLLAWDNYFDPVHEHEKMAARGIRFVVPEDGDVYPPLLREIYDPPLGLYLLGEYKWGTRSIGIVGSRRITPYGREMARGLARGLAAAGWCIVSGMARGIDTAVHQGALDAGGATVAVLGCGPDIVYPPENLDLYRKIAEMGAVVSEFSLGRSADRQTFPMRNRIVAGMCRAIIVIESDINGGSMITARFAGEQGRLVCAVPGRADQSTSRGCHALIRDGATLVTSVEEVLEELGEPTAPGVQRELGLGNSPAGGINRALSDDEKKILVHFAGGIAHTPDTLAELTGLPVSTLMGMLLMMELKRLLVKTSNGRYEAVGDMA